MFQKLLGAEYGAMNEADKTPGLMNHLLRNETNKKEVNKIINN